MQDKVYVDEQQGRLLICETGRLMYEKGFVAANDGNISVMLEPDRILCTPTGISKGFMKEDDLIIVDMSGRVIHGKRLPSSEIRMHLEVYRNNDTACAVVHAHPVNATALAVAGVPMDRPFLTEGVIVTGQIPLAAYATAGTEEVAEAIRPFCRDYKGVLLANHGAAAWGRDLTAAWYVMESIEQMAHIYIKSKCMLGNINFLSEENIAKLKERYLNSI